MKKILSFNTILNKLIIIIQENNNILDINEIENKKQSEIIIKEIINILNKNKLSFSDIDVFSCLNGPGNFTGIKTSLSVLKGFKISTNKKIIINSLFDVISYNENNFDTIILSIHPLKYYIKENNKYFMIYKKDFILDNSKKILTNDISLNANNIKITNFSNEKWVNLNFEKVKNNFYTENIIPLYIEEPNISKKK